MSSSDSLPPPSDNTDFASVRMPDSRAVTVVVVSSVALAFISFWRAAAIVLCDLASTAYYIGGISEQAIGKAAPWFILGVMLFSYAVRSVYVESCTLFTRGGVYKVVKGAVGGGFAKLSVSALMFDYILTGPISAVAAGQYIVGLLGDMLKLATQAHSAGLLDATTHKGVVDLLTVLIAVSITLYFWRLNLIGIHESSDKALRIMQLTTVMGILIIGWSALTLALHPPAHVVPPLHPVFTGTSLDPLKPQSSMGWLEGVPRLVGAIGIVVAFGHSLLAMSGEESLAQVNREIQAPKLKNLLRAGFVIFLYSMLLTSLVSFLAVMIIPDGKRVSTLVVNNGVDTRTAAQSGTGYVAVDYLRRHDAAHPGGDWGYVLDDAAGDHPRPTEKTITVDLRHQHVERDDGGYRDNLINGLVQYLAGPSWLKIIMECFVVIVGFLILAGAVNTSMIGSNGVLNRLAEDGVLTPWFQHPQKRFGTTHRLINLVAVLQLIVIVGSLGDVNTLGEAYAFGVIWSFVFMTMSMAVLRYKDRSPRAYEVPFNLKVKIKDGTLDLPIGIIAVFLVLASTAVINLFTKKTATEWGIGFTAAFMVVFTVVERISHGRRGGHSHEHLEQFNEATADAVSPAALGLLYPNPILVAVRNPGSLKMLNRVLGETDTAKQDVVVVTCKVLPPMTAGVTTQERGIQDADRSVLTRVVTVAEEAGKRVRPLVLPTNNPLYAIATAARDLHAGSVVLGESERVAADELAEQFALAWGMAMGDAAGDQPLTLRVIGLRSDQRFDL